jgi:adenosine deaminase
VDYSEFLRRLPKVELHCHLEGSVRPLTAIELAKKRGVPLPTDDPDKLYDYGNIVDFLKVYVQICRSVVGSDEFARITYESLEDGVKLGNLKYREMFFNPTMHYQVGATYRSAVDGVIEGIRAAEKDHGVRCRLIPGIDRSQGPQAAVQLVQEALDNPREEVVGIGQDALTSPDNLEEPGLFVEAYELARRGGLRLTAHAGEIDASGPKDILEALDVLGCERIDHGYHVIDDPKLVARTRDEGLFFTCCPHSSEWLYGWNDYRTHPVKRMFDEGLGVTFNTDDPPMFGTDLGWEYEDTCARMGLSADQAVQVALNGIDATWLDDDEKRHLRAAFGEEIKQLKGELTSSPQA